MIVPFKYTSAIILICFIVSCEPIKKCGEQNTEIKNSQQFYSKRLKNVIHERDELCNENNILKEDTISKLSNIQKLNNQLYDLSKKYSDLENTSETKLVKLNNELNLKSKDLENKEKLLTEREQKLNELKAIIAKQDSITNALTNIVKNALLEFKPDELTVEMKNGKVYVSMSDKLLFKSGSATVDEKGKNAIIKLAEVLNKNSDIEVTIEGHTDNVPIKTAIYKNNWDLSVTRATSIVVMLSEENSVIPTKLTAAGRGEFFPKASNETTEGRALNRRTEIILSPKLDELFKIIH